MAVLIVTAVFAFVVWNWGNRVVRASDDYQPAPTFTEEDQSFALRAHALIKSGVDLDKDALRKRMGQSVEDFASDDLNQQVGMLDRLKDTVDAIRPDFDFKPVETEPPAPPLSSGACDREYVDEIIRSYEKARSLPHSNIQNADLAQFATMWQTQVDKRLHQAKSMLATAPDEKNACGGKSNRRHH